jgi:hypothetical protein
MDSTCCDNNSFDFNDVVDLLLPLYLILAIVIIICFTQKETTPQNSAGYYKLLVSPTIPRHRAQNKAINTFGDWKAPLSGYWNICWADDLEKWLKFLKKPYVRSMAQSMFFQINQRVSFVKEDTVETLVLERERGGKLSNWILRIPLGLSEFQATEVRATDHEETMSVFKAWLSEETQELFFETVTPAETSATDRQLRVLVSRRSIDENTLLMTWDGMWLGTDEKEAFKSHARRLQEAEKTAESSK